MLKQLAELGVLEQLAERSGLSSSGTAAAKEYERKGWLDVGDEESSRNRPALQPCVMGSLA